MSAKAERGVARTLVRHWHRAQSVFDLAETRRLGPVVDALVRGELERGERPSETPLETLHRSDDAALQLSVARAWAGAEVADGLAIAPKRRPAGRPRRLRLCYLSAEIGEFAAAGPIRDLFRLHDRDRVETVVVALNPADGSPWRAWAERTADRFLDLSAAAEAERAERVGALAPDVLIDLTGWTRPETLRLAAGVGAPVTASFLGFPGSSGAPWIDYLIGDPVAVPGPVAAQLSEQVLRVPGAMIPADPETPVRRERFRRSDLGLPEDGVVIGAFNSTRKLSEPFLAAASGVLRRIPAAVLWLLADDATARRNIEAALPGFGIDPARVVFADRVRYTDHLDRLPHADLTLDSFPYAGGATTGLSLLAGVPVVTMAGTTLVSRLGACQVAATGFPDLAVAGVDDWVERVVALASDREALGHLRDRLSTGVRALPLCDIAGLARALEQGCEVAFDRVVRGEGPAEIEVSATAGEVAGPRITSGAPRGN